MFYMPTCLSDTSCNNMSVYRRFVCKLFSPRLCAAKCITVFLENIQNILRTLFSCWNLVIILQICWKRKRKICTEISVPHMVLDTLIYLSYNFNPWHIFYSRGICTFFSVIRFYGGEWLSGDLDFRSIPLPHISVQYLNSRCVTRSRCYEILRDLVTHRV